MSNEPRQVEFFAIQDKRSGTLLDVACDQEPEVKSRFLVAGSYLCFAPFRSYTEAKAALQRELDYAAQRGQDLRDNPPWIIVRMLATANGPKKERKDDEDE